MTQFRRYKGFFKKVILVQLDELDELGKVTRAWITINL